PIFPPGSHPAPLSARQKGRNALPREQRPPPQVSGRLHPAGPPPVPGQEEVSAQRRSSPVLSRLLYSPEVLSQEEPGALLPWPCTGFFPSGKPPAPPALC